MKAATRIANWQISVIPAIEKTIILTVPANCSTATLYDELKKHPLAPVAEQHILISHEGQLEYSNKKHLSDYDIQNKSVIQLTVRVNGGVWPSVGDIEARARILEASERIQITTSDKHPDVFGLDLDDTPRAILSCGHAVAPLSLALHCYHELEKGQESIKCPDRKCGSRWKFSQIREAACLSEDESQEFERKALFNGMRKKQGEEIKSCPKCSAFCTRSTNQIKRVVCSNCTSRSGDQYEFCWICLRQWKDRSGTEKCGNPECGGSKEVFGILAACTLKDIEGVMCPSKRACPKCFTLIEHAKMCKHMICTSCKHEFCFICLKPFPCKVFAWTACDAAPRQSPAKVGPTAIVRPTQRREGRLPRRILRFPVSVTASSGNLRIPPSSESQRIPSSSGSQRMPPSLGNIRLPPSSENLRIPPSSENLRIPPSSENLRLPPSSENLRIPPSSENLRITPSSENLRIGLPSSES